MSAITLGKIPSILEKLGIILDKQQPHVSGERFLMMKSKLVLAGNSGALGKVIVKVAVLPDGKQEIRAEKNARDTLENLAFANDTLQFPKEILFKEIDGHLFLITEYISQDKVFISYELEQQFFMALRAFEAQEAFHATTFEHIQKVKKTFVVHAAADYLKSFELFGINALNAMDNDATRNLWERAGAFLASHRTLIDTYANHLVHTDFVPHNFRVQGNKLYLLDAAAVEFGNKYEGWARFLNYMLIHNVDLEKLLSDYLKKNRGEKEYLCLRLMRVFKAGFLVDFYARSLEKTTGDLHELTKIRLKHWLSVLEFLMEDKPVPHDLIETYTSKRNALRSSEEKARQKEFTIV